VLADDGPAITTELDQRLLLVVLRGVDFLAAFFAGRLDVARRVDEVDALRVDEVDAFFAGDLDVALAVDFVSSLPDCARFRWLR
jgi:hypothetical protein